MGSLYAIRRGLREIGCPDVGLKGRQPCNRAAPWETCALQAAVERCMPAGQTRQYEREEGVHVSRNVIECKACVQRHFPCCKLTGW